MQASYRPSYGSGSFGRRRSPLARLAAGIGALVAAAVIVAGMLLWHGVGHAVAARLAGDSTATFTLFRHTSAITCLGCSHYDSAALGSVGNMLVNAAGVIATQLAVVVAVLLLTGVPRAHRAVRVGLGLVAVVGMADLAARVAQALLHAMPAQLALGPDMSYRDGTAVAWFLGDWWGWSGTLALQLVTGIGSAIVVAEIWWLLRSWQRATRRPSAYGELRMSHAR